ncbi:Protein CLEC16A [Entamoeba marina]
MFSRDKSMDNSKKYNEKKKMHSLGEILKTPQRDVQTHLNALRDTAEMLVWDDDIWPTVFELVKKGKKPTLLQFLQWFAILVENIKTTSFLYFLLSQNNIEAVLAIPFDRNDIDIISPYISMLKSISLRLTSDTLQFFYNHQKNTCPVLSEAVSLLNHRESMIVSHSRNIILQFTAFTNDNAFNEYYLAYSQKHFYPHLSSLILPHIHSLPSTLQTLIDDVYFLSDLLTLPAPYPTVLTASLFDNLIYPHVFPSFIYPTATTPRKVDSLQF